MEKRTLAFGTLIALSTLACVGMAGMWGQDYARYASDERALEQLGEIPRNPIAETPNPEPDTLDDAPALADAGEEVDEDAAHSEHRVEIDGIDAAHDLSGLIRAEEHDGRIVTVHDLRIVAPANPAAQPRAFWARAADAPENTGASEVLLVMPPEATAANPIDPRYDLHAGNTVDVVGSLAKLQRIAPSVTADEGTMGLSVRTIHTL